MKLLAGLMMIIATIGLLGWIFFIFQYKLDHLMLLDPLISCGYCFSYSVAMKKCIDDWRYL